MLNTGGLFERSAVGDMKNACQTVLGKGRCVGNSISPRGLMAMVLVQPCTEQESTQRHQVARCTKHEKTLLCGCWLSSCCSSRCHSSCCCIQEGLWVCLHSLQEALESSSQQPCECGRQARLKGRDRLAWRLRDTLARGHNERSRPEDACRARISRGVSLSPSITACGGGLA